MRGMMLTILSRHCLQPPLAGDSHSCVTVSLLLFRKSCLVLKASVEAGAVSFEAAILIERVGWEWQGVV